MHLVVVVFRNDLPQLTNKISAIQPCHNSVTHVLERFKQELHTCMTIDILLLAPRLSTSLQGIMAEILTRLSNDTKVKGEIKYLGTAEAYDLWSSVYDTDGNFLQALDTLEIPALLDTAFRELKDAKVVDLGCGTGRNTLAVLDHSPWELMAVDLSPKMLEIAEKRCTAKLETLNVKPAVKFGVFDMISQDTGPVPDGHADLLISTLVLEHIPIETFIRTVSRILRPGGLCVLTNMHSEMGGISQAGFVTESGDKIRPTSYAHSAADVVKIAAIHGLEIVQDSKAGLIAQSQQLKEITLDRDLASKLGPRAEKWIGIAVWYGGILRKNG